MSKPIVVIDPGYGGLGEKDLNLGLALKTAQRLHGGQQAGFSDAYIYQKQI